MTRDEFKGICENEQELMSLLEAMPSVADDAECWLCGRLHTAVCTTCDTPFCDQHICPCDAFGKA